MISTYNIHNVRRKWIFLRLSIYQECIKNLLNKISYGYFITSKLILFKQQTYRIFDEERKVNLHYFLLISHATNLSAEIIIVSLISKNVAVLQ